MYFRFFTHIIGFLINIWWQLILFTNNYEVIYVIKTVMKYYLEKIDESFHQRFPNMVQRLFTDVIHDAIWFMNIHEQNHPWFLAMQLLYMKRLIYLKNWQSLDLLVSPLIARNHGWFSSWIFINQIASCNDVSK